MCWLQLLPAKLSATLIFYFAIPERSGVFFLWTSERGKWRVKTAVPQAPLVTPMVEPLGQETGHIDFRDLPAVSSLLEKKYIIIMICILLIPTVTVTLSHIWLGFVCLCSFSFRLIAICLFFHHLRYTHVVLL